MIKLMKNIETERKIKDFRELVEEYGSSIVNGDSLIMAIEKVKRKATESRMNVTNEDIEKCISFISLSKEIGKRSMEIYLSRIKRWEVPYIQ